VKRQETWPNLADLSNKMKEWFARMGIGTFILGWKMFHRLSRHPLPAKDHYYMMMLFRLLFRSYNVWISYPNPIVPQTIVHLRVNLCENNQQWFFRLRQQYDRKEIYLLAEGMKDAEVFVDIGSNVGIYALTIAQAFPNKQVVAFEPLQTNYDSLQANITRNKITNCLAYQKAICKADKPVRFYINPIHDGGGSLILPEVYKTGDVEINVDLYQKKHPEFQPWLEVDTERLNEVLSQRSVVKIDVEGAEIDVLQSGYDALKTGLVDLMIVEVIQDTVDEVVQLLDNLGFDAFILPEFEAIRKGTLLPWFVKNIICVRKNTPAHGRICQKCGSNRERNRIMQFPFNAEFGQPRIK